jgi:membrane-bound metal-dependent hydrolase YbcI (DUF457 family)
MLVLLSCADRMIARRPFWGRAFWAALDVLVHGAVALLVAEPCIRRAASRKQALVLSGLAFVSATALDVDHFISAGTLEVGAALSLAARPPTHSLTFALMIGALTSLFFRDRTAGWVAFAAIASHVLRDAAMGTAPLLWPLSVDAVPRWAYICGELGLLLASRAFRAGARRHVGTRDLQNCVYYRGLYGGRAGRGGGLCRGRCKERRGRIPGTTQIQRKTKRRVLVLVKRASD